METSSDEAKTEWYQNVQLRASFHCDDSPKTQLQSKRGERQAVWKRAAIENTGV